MKHKISVKREKGSERKPTPAASKGKFKTSSVLRSKKKTTEYSYHKLNDLVRKEIDRINIYAAILDCSGIYYSKTAGKYICTVKLVDETVNPLSSGRLQFVTATMFAGLASRLPQPSMIGSILRIHRGQTKKNRGDFQLNCDVNIKGAWTLFDPKDSVIPIDKSSKTHTFTAKDKQRLKKIRDFANDYFEENEQASTTLEQGGKQPTKEFDTTCYVLNIKSKGIMTRILLCDMTKVVKLDILSSRASHLSPLSVVRLRGVSYPSDKTSNHLRFNDYSNILNIPSDYQSAKKLGDSLKKKNTSKSVIEEMQYYIHDSNEPLILGRPSNRRLKVVSLRELYFGDLLRSKDRTFRINVDVIEIGPKKPSDWICAMNKHTKDQVKLKDALDKNKTLDKDYEYYIKLQLFVKDKSVKTDTNMYMIFLCTVDNRGKEFIKAPVGRKKPDETYLKRLKRIYKMLTRPWTVLDCTIEAVNTREGQPIFFLVNTELDLP